jgi:hypothetical protein
LRASDEVGRRGVVLTKVTLERKGKKKKKVRPRTMYKPLFLYRTPHRETLSRTLFQPPLPKREP